MSIFGEILPLPKKDDKASSTATANLSPYLNFDPNYVTKMQPEFIYPDDSHMSSTSKRTHITLPLIGACFLTGSGVGGMSGLYRGFRATTLAGQMGKVRRTQVMNYIMKQGTTTGCTLGIIASFYSCIGLGVTYLRDKEDTMNTFLAAGLTGMIYKSTAGLRMMGIGGAVGVGLAGIYTIVTDNDKIWSKFKYNRM